MRLLKGNISIQNDSFALLCILLFVGADSYGCIGKHFDSEEKEGNNVGGLVVAIACDQSESTVINQTPAIDAQTIDDVIEILRERGGELSFAGINERKPQLHRVRLVAEQGTSEKTLAAQKLNEREVVRIRPVLYRGIRERKAQRTRLFETLELCALFLKEPHHPINAQRVLLVCSDFEEDFLPRKKQHPIRLPENTIALAVGAHPDSVAQVLAGGRIFAYTSLQGVTDYLRMEPLP